ncbi:MAG: M20/M25/M40 family metallo-hydrolase [Dehalococcoidia bacterium]|jgi:acetylornithine deacetylase/succinyl-diaminopimelate desuccinylase-like protein|nr:M20/M25/M40 family metallo-hydrolase [Dehalococcoidia bacterium]
MTDSPVEILQDLIRFDTTNPPGNERASIEYLERLFAGHGVETKILARDPERPNLLARLPGGDGDPLLLYGHVDVVPTDGQRWDRPPFSGEIAHGFVWGRGAIDMKGGLAMMVAALLRMKEAGETPSGDLIFAAVSDEERGGVAGARFLVEEHPEEFRGVRYAVGEVGGFAADVSGLRVYPIMIAEKQSCLLTLTFSGPSGHGSLGRRGGAMAHMAEAVRRIESRQLPVHVTPAARESLSALAGALPFPKSLFIKLLMRPRFTNRVLRMIGAPGAMFDAMLHNTVAPTVVAGGSVPNVIPGEVTLQLDGRVLPGYSPEDLVSELRSVLGDLGDGPDAPEIEVRHYDPGPGVPDMGIFQMLASVIEDADPGSVAVPALIPGTTDARFFSQLGIQTYGFLPMNLPQEIDFAAMFHAGNERIPLDALEFGADAIRTAIRRYDGRNDQPAARPAPPV